MWFPLAPLEGLSIITLLIGKTASTRAAIGSWPGRSVNRAHRVGRSLILADLADMAVCSFEHCGDLGDFWRLLEPGELIGGHGQVSAWGLVDIVANNTDKFVEVVLEWAWLSLRVELIVASSLS